MVYEWNRGSYSFPSSELDGSVQLATLSADTTVRRLRGWVKAYTEDLSMEHGGLLPAFEHVWVVREAPDAFSPPPYGSWSSGPGVIYWSIQGWQLKPISASGGNRWESPPDPASFDTKGQRRIEVNGALWFAYAIQTMTQTAIGAEPVRVQIAYELLTSS